MKTLYHSNTNIRKKTIVKRRRRRKKKLEKGKGRIWGFGFGFCVVDIMENAGSKGQRRQIERECWENNKIIIITKKNNQ